MCRHSGLIYAARDISPRPAPVRRCGVPRTVSGYIALDVTSAVGHNVYDHTSVLKMIEQRWNLRPLTARDAAAANLAETITFGSSAVLKARSYSVPNGPFGQYCAPLRAHPSSRRRRGTAC